MVLKREEERRRESPLARQPFQLTPNDQTSAWCLPSTTEQNEHFHYPKMLFWCTLCRSTIIEIKQHIIKKKWWGLVWCGVMLTSKVTVYYYYYGSDVPYTTAFHYYVSWNSHFKNFDVCIFFTECVFFILFKINYTTSISLHAQRLFSHCSSTMEIEVQTLCTRANSARIRE